MTETANTPCCLAQRMFERMLEVSCPHETGGGVGQRSVFAHININVHGCARLRMLACLRAPTTNVNACFGLRYVVSIQGMI